MLLENTRQQRQSSPVADGEESLSGPDEPPGFLPREEGSPTRQRAASASICDSVTWDCDTTFINVLLEQPSLFWIQSFLLSLNLLQGFAPFEPQEQH